MGIQARERFGVRDDDNSMIMMVMVVPIKKCAAAPLKRTDPSARSRADANPDVQWSLGEGSFLPLLQ